MIRMFVSNQDSVEVFNSLFYSRKAGQRFAFSDAGIYKEAGALGFQQRHVAGASGRQYRNAKADRFPQE
jgi:hypothetical protein